MSTHFDTSTLTSEEFRMISQRINKKTSALDKNYVTSDEQVMKFIEGIAMRSENRDAFWKRLLRTLESNPSRKPAPAAVVVAKYPDKDIFAWFQVNQAKLQTLLFRWASLGRQSEMSYIQLVDALNWAKHFPNVGNLNENQISVLRSLHTTFTKRNTADPAQTKTSPYNGNTSLPPAATMSSGYPSQHTTSSGHPNGQNFSHNNAANGQTFSQNNATNGLTSNHSNSSYGSSFNHNNNTSNGLAFGHNGTSNGSTFNHNNLAVGPPFIKNNVQNAQNGLSYSSQSNGSSRPTHGHNNNTSSNGSSFNQNSAATGPTFSHSNTAHGPSFNQYSATNGLAFNHNNVANAPAAYHQVNTVNGNSNSNSNGNGNGSAFNHNNTATGSTFIQNSSLSNGPPFHQKTAAIGPSFNQSNGLNAPTTHHNNTANGPTFSHNNTANGPTFSHNNTANGPTLHHNNVSNGPTFSHNNTANGPTFSLNNTSNGPALNHNNTSNRPTFSHNNLSNGPIFNHNNIANGPTFQPNNTSPKRAEPAIETSSQLRNDILAKEKNWLKDFYDKIYHLFYRVEEIIGKEEFSLDFAPTAVSIDELIIKIDLYDKEMGNITATIGDSALTKNAIHGFREILKNCKVNLMKKEIKVVNTNSGGSDVMLKVLSDKDIPFFNLLRMALSSVCLDKYSVMNEKNINTDFNNKRKANRISESVTASASTHLFPGVFAQKRNVRMGYVTLR